MSDAEYYPIELFHWCGMKDEHINIVIEILETYPEYVNEKTQFKDNCLLIATRSQNINMVKYILANTNIDINHENHEGENALIVAIKSGNIDLINCFLNNKTINIFAVNKKGENIYHMLAKIGNADLIEKILLVDENRHIAKKDNTGRHCLFNLIANYMTHKSYWCFEVVQEAMNNEELWQKDINGIDILQFTKVYEKDQYVGKTYTPLVHILNSRTLFTNLNESLPINEDSQKGNGKIKV